MLLHTNFLIANPITNRDLDQLEEPSRIVQYSLLILRLVDDLESFEVKFLTWIKSYLYYKTSKSYKYYFYLFLCLIIINFFDKTNNFQIYL